MRKLLAVLLAVLMLASVVAVLPVGAEDEITCFDGTTSDYEFNDLIITEAVTNTTSGLGSVTSADGKTTTDYSSYNAFTYFEVYNPTEKAINLYDYCILRSTCGKRSTVAAWNDTHLFDRKNVFQAGPIITGVPSNDSNPVTTGKGDVRNPDSAMVPSHGFAIVWVWNNNAYTVADKTAKGNAMTSDDWLAGPDGLREFARFRDHFDVPDDTLVISVFGQTSHTTTPYQLEFYTGGYYYALAKKTFNISNNTAADPQIACLFQMQTGATGLVRSLIATADAVQDDTSIQFVPAKCVPDLINRENELNVDGYDPEKDAYKDFVQANYAISYKEMAQFAVSEEPTPGAMTAAQWAYVDPEHAPENIKTSDTWAEDAKTAFAESKVVTVNEAEDRTEVDIHHNFVNQDDIADWVDHQNQPSGGTVNRQPSKNKKGGLPTWALILIIVGGVVVVAGAATGVIFGVKKKAKPVAADDVASEGEVPVVDDTKSDITSSDEDKK